MPRFDKTGPEGKGPKTGRVLGRCRTSNTSQEEEQGSLFGRGRGRSFRFFWRRKQGDSGSEDSGK